MKFNNLAINSKRIFKIGIICLVALILALSPLMSIPSMADQITGNSGTEWTRIMDNEALKAAFYNDKSLNRDDSNWVPILILYEYNGKWYYLQSYSRNGDAYNATLVTSMTGIKPGQDSFTTRGNLNSLLCKAENGNPEYILSYRKNGGESPEDKCLAINIKWYGCAWAAACRGDFRDAPRSNPSSAEDDSGAACSASIRTAWNINAQGNGYFEIAWRSHKGNVCDRHWQRSGDKIEISKWSKDRYTNFIVYSGKVTGSAVQTTSTTVQPYSYAKLCDYTIKSNVEIYVAQGACLVLDGYNYNCGHILVDGGTLVIRGVVDADTGGTSGSGKAGSYNTSDIQLINGGKLIIESSGVLLNRNASSGVYLSGGSSAMIEGSMIIAKKLEVGDNCILRAMPGSFICIGRQPISTEGGETYTPAGIASNKDTYLDSVSEKSDDGGYVTFGSNSSFISYGGVFVEDLAKITAGNNAYRDCAIAYNAGATLGSMMRQW